MRIYLGVLGILIGILGIASGIASKSPQIVLWLQKTLPVEFIEPVFTHISMVSVVGIGCIILGFWLISKRVKGAIEKTESDFYKSHGININEEAFQVLTGMSDQQKRTLLDFSPRILTTLFDAKESGKEVDLSVLGVADDMPILLKTLSLKDFKYLEKPRVFNHLADKTPQTDIYRKIEYYKKVLEFVPWDSISMMSIGVQYYKLGEISEALQWIKYAAKIDPKNQRIQRNLTNTEKDYEFVQKNIEGNEVPVNIRYSDNEQLHSKLRKIKLLSQNSSEGALNNLFKVLEFDVSGEVAVHASLALAFGIHKTKVKQRIQDTYIKEPVKCGAGYPPSEGNDIFPKIRLLYPLTWMNETTLMKQLLDNSGSWLSADAGKQAAYKLIDAVEQGRHAIANQLCFIEFLDEAGDRESMDLTIAFYLAAEFDKEMWNCVKSQKN